MQMQVAGNTRSYRVAHADIKSIPLPVRQVLLKLNSIVYITSVRVENQFYLAIAEADTALYPIKNRAVPAFQKGYADHSFSKASLNRLPLISTVRYWPEADPAEPLTALLVRLNLPDAKISPLSSN